MYPGAEMPVSISCDQERASRCRQGVEVDEKHRCWEDAGGQHIGEPWAHQEPAGASQHPTPCNKASNTSLQGCSHGQALSFANTASNTRVSEGRWEQGQEKGYRKHRNLDML